MLYLHFGQKNPSFWNKFGKTQPIQTKFGISGQVKRWQCSGNFGRDDPFWAKWGLRRVPRSWRFFCVVN